MRVFHSVVIREKPPSKRPHKESSVQPVYSILVLIICKFQKDWIKIARAMLWTKSNMDLFSTQGQVTPK